MLARFTRNVNRQFWRKALRLKYVITKTSITSESIKDTGNQTYGERWSRTSRMPFMMPDMMFMMKETVIEIRNGFQASKVRTTPSITATSKLMTKSARKPKIKSTYWAAGPVMSRGGVVKVGILIRVLERYTLERFSETVNSVIKYPGTWRIRL